MATVGPTNIPAFFNSDADFRTWGSTISAALATLGLVQTSDTGQINWTTVTKPAATNTAQGYEIWRFADTLQSTVPVYLKLEYGSAGATDRPGLWLTVGSGSNGSGTLTGQVSTRQQMSPNASKTSGVTLPFYASGNSGELLLVVNVDTVTAGFGLFVGVERPKDSTDTVTSDGVLQYACSANNNMQTQFVPATGAIPAANTSAWPSVHPNFWSRSASGANVDVAPVFIPLQGVWRYSHVNVHKSGDLASGGSYTATMLGGTHTYMSVDVSITSGTTVVTGLVAGVSIRWE